MVVTAAQGQQAKPKVVTQDLASRDTCVMCHSGATEAVPRVPASHEGRPIEVCLWCHAPDAAMQTQTPQAVSHTIEGRDQCMMCHKPGAMEPVPDTPADHEPRDVKYCIMCHVTPQSE